MLHPRVSVPSGLSMMVVLEVCGCHFGRGEGEGGVVCHDFGFSSANLIRMKEGLVSCLDEY